MKHWAAWIVGGLYGTGCWRFDFIVSSPGFLRCLDAGECALQFCLSCWRLLLELRQERTWQSFDQVLPHACEQ